MNRRGKKLPPELSSLIIRPFLPALSRGVTYIVLSSGLLLLDLVTGPFLQFPILFVVPIALSAWFYSSRLAHCLAVILPVGRLLIAEFVDSQSPFVFIAANCVIRIAVLLLIAFLVNRTANQTKGLEQRIDTFVTICAWSSTVEYHGQWMSFEEYLRRRFNLNTT